MEGVFIAALLTGLLYLIFSAPKERSNTGNSTRWQDIKDFSFGVSANLKELYKDYKSDPKRLVDKLPEDQRKALFLALFTLYSRRAYNPSEELPSTELIHHLLTVFIPQWDNKTQWIMARTFQDFSNQSLAKGTHLGNKLYTPEFKSEMDMMYESLMDTLYPNRNNITTKFM